MTRLESLYRSLGLMSTKGQAAICDDFAGRPSILADCFARALSENIKRPPIDQPFFPSEAEKPRGPIGPEDRNDNRVYYRLQAGERVVVSDSSTVYEFEVVARQVPPLRETGNNNPCSGRGGIDYVGISGTSPVLGEIKLGEDQNPFYAFVQLLHYLSQMASDQQVDRARKHLFEGRHIHTPPSIDLHILLADFNDRGLKGGLITGTEALVKGLRARLQTRHPQAGARLGNVLCMKLTTSLATGLESDQIRLCWLDPMP